MQSAARRSGAFAAPAGLAVGLRTHGGRFVSTWRLLCSSFFGSIFTSLIGKKATTKKKLHRSLQVVAIPWLSFGLMSKGRLRAAAKGLA